MNIEDLKKLSKTDRLQAMEVIWDSLLYEDDELATTKWHENILEDRKAKISDGTAKFISLADLKASRSR